MGYHMECSQPKRGVAVMTDETVADWLAFTTLVLFCGAILIIFT
jgi:hypothetical protein